MPDQIDLLLEEISKSARKTIDTAGRSVAVINDFDTLLLARHHNCSARQVHLFALDQQIWPQRYLRNADSVKPAEQKKLLQSRVAVIGAGGLGGYVLQLLARIGIGTLVTVDPETFDETNLNRQALARTDTLDEFKTDTAAGILSQINPAIDIVAHTVRITADNADTLLKECHAAVDALDNAEDRLILQQGCARCGIPLVHGALAGFEGRVMTVYPGDKGLELLYAKGDDASAELRLGVPAIAPAFIASLQAMEVFKILLHRGRPFQKRFLHADLEGGSFEEYGLE